MTGELEAFQRTLAERSALQPNFQVPTSRPLLVGGVFVATARGGEGIGAAGDPAWAAAVIMRREAIVDSCVLHGLLDAPYVAGLLALRERRLLAETIGMLRIRPDVLLVNATGRDHPRRAGLALQIGAELDLPTVGVTDRPLRACGPQPAPDVGAVAELRLEGELVGYRVTTCGGARPLVVHAAWRTDANLACSVVLDLASAQRTPAPLREARRLARSARASHAGVTRYGNR